VTPASAASQRRQPAPPDKTRAHHLYEHYGQIAARPARGRDFACMSAYAFVIVLTK